MTSSEDTTDTRSRILEAAGLVFADKGLKAATVRDICEAAGVNIASINYYFRSKDRLYIETIKHAHAEAARLVPLPDWPAGISAEVMLRDYIRMTVGRLVGCKPAAWHIRLMMRESAFPSQACQEVVEEFIRPHFILGVQILQQLLPQDTPEHLLQKWTFSIIGQCLHYRIGGPIVAQLVDPQSWSQDFSVEQLTAHITQLTFAALGREVPSDPEVMNTPEVSGDPENSGDRQTSLDPSELAESGLADQFDSRKSDPGFFQEQAQRAGEGIPSQSGQAGRSSDEKTVVSSNSSSIARE